MNWKFGFFDAETLKRAALAAGLGTGASTLAPQEAEGAQLPGFQRGFVSRFVARDKENFPIGDIEPEVFAQIQEKFPMAKNSVNAGTHAGFSRFVKSGWLPSKTAHKMGEVLDSKDAVVVKNWKEQAGKAMNSEYGILIPDRNDPIFVPFFLDSNNEIVFKTVFSPSKGQIRRAGSGEEGGLLPLISRSQDASSTQRMPLSAVKQEPAQVDNIAEFSAPDKLTHHAVPLTAALGAGMALPEMAHAAQGTPQSSAEPSLWAELARQAGLGSRGVLEGMGSGFTLGLGDPGRGLSDIMGLPVPQNETEQGRVGLNRSLASVGGTAFLGAGLAKAPGAVLSTVGRGLSSDPVADALLTLGDENFARMLEQGHALMDILEQHEAEDWLE